MIISQIKYIDVKTNQIICLRAMIENVGTHFFYNTEDYVVVDRKWENDEWVVYCIKFQIEP